MGLADFKDVDRNELSMIEVAHAILEDRGERMAFADIVNEVKMSGPCGPGSSSKLSMKKSTTQKTTATKNQLASTTRRSTPSWPRLKATT